MIETAIRGLLLADATVAALVGTRVYTGIMPQRPTFPLVVMTKVDKLSNVLMDGTVGPNTARVQVDCWADDVDEVRGLADAVNGSDDQSTRGPLHGFRGSREGLHIKLMELAVERATEYEPDTKLYRVSADYRAHL
jgi:hypothetical protein